MVQLVHMDARLDTLSDEQCQVNTHVGCIAQRQAMMGGYTVSSSPEDESDGSSSVDDAEDDDDGSPSDDEMSI